MWPLTDDKSRCSSIQPIDDAALRPSFLEAMAEHDAIDGKPDKTSAGGCSGRHAASPKPTESPRQSWKSPRTTRLHGISSNRRERYGSHTGQPRTRDVAGT